MICLMCLFILHACLHALFNMWLYCGNVVHVVVFPCCRLTEERGGCYTRVGLPLIENTSIVEQPLDLWLLTEKYKSAAQRIIKNARCNTAAKETIFSSGCSDDDKNNNEPNGRKACLSARLQRISDFFINCHISHSQEARTALFPLLSAGSHARPTGPSHSCSPLRRWQRCVRRQPAGDGRHDWGGEKCVWRNRQGQHAHLVHRLVTLTTVICISELRGLNLFFLRTCLATWEGFDETPFKSFDVMMAVRYSDQSNDIAPAFLSLSSVWPSITGS